MSQAGTHMIVAVEGSSQKPELNRDYSHFLVLGSMGGPDLFYFSGVPHIMDFFKRRYEHDYSRIADIIHEDKTLDYFCSMLDFIKKTPSEIQNKLKAFAYGFYSHVVTDAIVHPFVYFFSGDHPTQHSDSQLIGHKHIENVGDWVELGCRGKNFYSIGYGGLIRKCHQQGSNRTLDKDVFNMLLQGFKAIYESLLQDKGIDYDSYFGKFAGTHQDPFMEAYRDYNTVYRKLPRFRAISDNPQALRVLPIRFRVLIPKTYVQGKELSAVMPRPRKKWIDSRNPNIPSYSLPELVNKFAISATKMVIDASERFFSSDATSSREFFRQHAKRMPYLQANYSLDTGKRAELSEAIGSLKDPREALECGLEELVADYEAVRAA